MATELDLSRAVEFAPGIYWLGYEDKGAGFHCNPYLLVDGEEAVLIEPGSIPHYPQVARKLVQVIDPGRVSHIILSHQDPDLCASLPRFEELIARPDLKLVTHWRAAVLIAHYGVRSAFYHVDANGWKLTLRSGRTLRFIFAPYCHFPGAFMTFDPTSGVLFSGDLFGAFSFDWHLFANEYYLEAMKAFHENYMPGREILASAMARLRGLDIRFIAPQHGSIIDRDPWKYIDALANLECGDYMFEQ